MDPRALPPRMTLETWLRENPGPPNPPASVTLQDDSTCVDFVTSTWHPQMSASWVNPGGLTGVKVRWYTRGGFRVAHNLAGNATGDSYTLEPNTTDPTVQFLCFVSFQNALGSSAETSDTANANTPDDCH